MYKHISLPGGARKAVLQYEKCFRSNLFQQRKKKKEKEGMMDLKSLARRKETAAEAAESKTKKI